MSDPANVVALDQIRALAREELRIEQVLARESDITIGIEHHYGFELSIDGILNEIETGEIDYQSARRRTSTSTRQPVVRLVDALLNDAVKRGASDIHFEPEQGFLRIRYRIDGVLRQIRSLHKNYWAAMVVRLKVMSGMNIAETRAPQDGRISLMLSGHQVDFRVSSQPTTHGENIVLRILDRDKGIVPLEDLGLHAEDLKTLKLMLARPEGIILVTGPTGSGKTTTLYSILNYINTEGINIMTLEDPVEYPMAMIRQTSVNEVVKLDFAYGIRSMMRQDPDVILVGEIRDQETAEMAFRAAMTGHQVYSTLHTNSSIGAMPRLMDLGVLPDIMAGNIIGVIAQRLVRKLCPHCKAPYDARRGDAPACSGIDADDDAPGLPGRGLRALRQHGLPRARRDHGALQARRRDRRADRAPRHRRARSSRTRRRKGFRTLADDAIARVLLGPDEPRGDLARGRPDRPRDLTATARMALFAYRAVDADGRVSTGNLDAVNAIDLELRLKRLGLDLLTFEGVKRSTAARTRNVTRTELITFCFHLSQLLKAGVNIIEALTDLRDTVDNAGFRQVIASLLEDIEGGLKLSEAMANHAYCFDSVFVALVRAGEQSGQLTEVLDELSENLKWQDEIASQAKKAMVYPADRARGDLRRWSSC